MARADDALAVKIETARARSFHDRVEVQKAFVPHEIGKDLVADRDALPAQPVKTESDRLLHGYILSDALALILGFFCGWLLAFEINAVVLDRYATATIIEKETLLPARFLVLATGMILWFGHTGHYRLRMPFWTETKKIVEATAFALLMHCFLLFVAKNDFSRVWVLSCWGFSLVAIIGLRALLRTMWRRRGVWTIPTLIIGDGPTAEEADDALQSEPGLGYRIVGYIRDLPQALQAAGNSWSKLCQAHQARHVVIALAGDDFINARPIFAQLMREPISFSVAPPMHNLSVHGMMPQYFLGHDVMLLVRNNGLDRPLSPFIKRSFDVVFSTLGLLALSPVILLLTIAVKLDGGPAFYRHKRIGVNGKTFSCLKFRSMVMKSDEVLREYFNKNPQARSEWLRDHKLRNDPRITFIGKILRRMSLDELPQLVNVLKGEMSLVGPRPIIPSEATRYERDIAFYYRVRPGMTGLWQVSGRNDVSYAERVRMDSWYVRNWSLWHDITIICKTFAVVIKQRGAY